MVLLSSSPLSSGGFVALPEVAAEIAVITDIASKANVTPNALSATQHATSDITDALTQASIVHIACHGSQDAGNPLESAFHLSGDRKITVSDLMELHLQDAHLAFLSACHTAKGDSKQPDQSIHLAAAMLFVGFKSVIGTMWCARCPHTSTSKY
jgi:CHAT domain-containing protein